MEDTLLPDVYSGTFNYDGGQLDTNGVRVVVQQKITPQLTATVNYSYGGVLDLVGMLASVAASALLYRWVEKPAQEMSSRVRFVRMARREVALAAATAK